MPEEVLDAGVLFDTGALWSIVEDSVFFIFSVIVGIAVLVLIYKILEWWFNRDRIELIDIHGINFKQLFESTKHNLVPAIVDQDLISLGSTHIWGLIKGTVKLIISVDENPKLSSYFDTKNFEFNYKKMDIDKYKPEMKEHSVVLFRLDKNRNRVMRFVATFIKFLRKEFVVEIPFDKIWVYKHLGGGSQILKPLERYSELKGSVYCDVDSLLKEYDGIFRPSDWSSKGLSVLETQLFKHRYMIALKDTVNQVRLAGLTDHKYQKGLDMQTVKRDVAINQASAVGVQQQGGDNVK